MAAAFRPIVAGAAPPLVHLSPFLTEAPAAGLDITPPDAVADLGPLLDRFRRVEQYGNIKGNPLGITRYDKPSAMAWSAVPIAGDTYVIAAATARKSAFRLADFVAKPLSLKEIEYCTGESAGVTISGMRMRGKMYFVETRNDKINAAVLMVYFLQDGIYHDSSTVHSLSGNTVPT